MSVRHERAFTLIELLVSTAVLSLLMVGVTAAFMSQERAQTRQDLAVAMEENLRVAEGMVVDALRGARYGMPSDGTLVDWVPWVTIGSNPVITADRLTVAGCFREPVAYLSADYTPGGSLNVLTVTPASGALGDSFDDDTRRLIRIDDDAYAHVVGVSSTALTIDANPDPDDPAAAGFQALARDYPVNTPICRVDVLTFSIQVDGTTGVPQLALDENHGNGPQVVAEGISSLDITPLAYGRYQVEIAAETERRDPISGAPLTRTALTRVSLRNS